MLKHHFMKFTLFLKAKISASLLKISCIKNRHQFSFSAPYDVAKETRESLFTKAAYCHLHLASKMLGSFIQIQIF